MKYANEILVLWFMSCATWIVAVNPDAHVAFLGISAGVFATYKWLQEREVTKRATTKQD